MRATINNLAISLLFLASMPAIGFPPGSVSSQPNSDETQLKRAGVDTRDESLIAFLKRDCPDEASLSKIDELIRQLGSRKYAERSAAESRLTALGLAAESALEGAAAKTVDAEVRAATSRCLDKIKSASFSVDVRIPAARLLAQRNSVKSAQTLINLLACAPVNGKLEEVLAFAIDDLARVGGKLPPELIDALESRSATKRAIAACIVASRGSEVERQKVRALLKDPSSYVRLRAAQGLLAAEDSSGIPALIELLDGSPICESWQARELLHWVARGNAPQIRTNLQSEWRRRYREAWADWWKGQAGKIDFKELERDAHRPCIFSYWGPDSVSKDGHLYFSSGFNPSAISGCDGTPRGSLYHFGKVYGAQLLPNGRLLVIGYPNGSLPDAAFLPPFLLEIDWSGRAEWSVQLADSYCDDVILEQLPEGRIHVVLTRQGMETSLAHSDMPNGSSPNLWKHCDRVDQKRSIAVPETAEIHGDLRQALDPERRRLVERDRTGRLIGESYCDCPAGCRVQVLFPVLRLGINEMPRRYSDLDSSLDARVHQLASESAFERYLAAKALLVDFKSKSHDALPSLLAALAKSRLGSGFGNYEIEAAIAASTDSANRDFPSFASSPNDLTRAGAIAMLGARKLPDQLSVEIIKAAMRDSSATVRMMAVQSAGAFRNSSNEIVPLLTAALSDNALPATGAALSVGEQASLSLLNFASDARPAIPALKQAILKARPWKMGYACAVLSAIANHDIESSPAILEWYLSVVRDKNAEQSLRVVCSDYFARAGKNPELVANSLVDILSDAGAPPKVRVTAIDVLRRMGKPAMSAIPALVKLRDNSDPTISNACREALRSIQTTK